MQINFLTIYGSPVTSYTIEEAQSTLLKFWYQSVLNGNIKLIKDAEIKFNNYSFIDYHDQERLKNEINASVYSGYNYLHNRQYWKFDGKHYYVFEELYNDLAETHQLMELTITVKDFFIND